MQAYIVHTREEGDATDVVTSIFLLFSTLVYALVDLGSSHSCNAPNSTKTLWPSLGSYINNTRIYLLIENN